MKNNLLKMGLLFGALVIMVMLFHNCSAAGGEAPGAVAPETPSAVSAISGNTQITLTWPSVTGATSYNVYWSISTGVTKLNGTKITGASSPYVHNTLSNGTAYYYVVTTINANGESVDSAQVSVTPQFPPVAPVGLTGAAGNTQATISLSSVSGAISYNLYWSTTTGVSKATGTKITGVTIPYVQTGLTNGIAYYYVATAENNSGESPDSVQVGLVPTANPNTWTAKTSLPAIRYANSVAGIVNLLYAVGGTNYGCGAYATLEVYNQATNAWTAKASMPTARWSLSSGVVNNILYALGGTNGCYTPSTGMTTNEAYDPANNTWSTKASMPIARAAHGVGVVNNIIYAFGGITSATPTNSVDAYNTQTNTWASVAPMTVAKNSPGVGVIDGIIYVVGGSNGTGVLNLVEAYNPATNTWTTKAPLPTARTSVAVGVINGILYAAGGHNGVSIVNLVEAYNPATNTWTTVAPMLTARTEAAAGVVNNILYAIGGNTSGGPVSTMEAYAP